MRVAERRRLGSDDTPDSSLKTQCLMKLGVYNAILHDRPLPEALKVIADLGLTGIEINSGGFLPPVHIPTFDDILDQRHRARRLPRASSKAPASRSPG